MAKAFNLHKCWYHSGNFPHYDIPKKRIEEITAACTVISTRELLQIIKNSCLYNKINI